MAGALAIAATLAAPAAAMADVDMLTVNTPGDAGDGGCDATCTWRDAVNDVFNDDVNADQDVIRVDLDDPATSTIVLTSGDTNPIDESLSIVNIGEAQPVISGGGLVRPLQINTDPGVPVQITGVDFVDGAGSGGAGLEIWDATVTLTDVAVTGSTSTGNGGGMVVVNAGLTIQNSTVADNHVTSGDSGGGIYASANSTVIVRGSTVSENSTAGGAGGGITVRTGADLTLDRSTVSGNSASGASQDGGGIFADGSSGTVSLSISNSTIAGNEVRGFGATGGGIFTRDVSPEPLVANTIVADNIMATLGGPLPSDVETFNDTFRLGFALVEELPTAPIDPVVPGSNIFGVDPKLGPLAANGGPTETHLLAVDSPAEDKGSATLTDQRGMLRPVDVGYIPNSQAPGANGAEIGAVELTAAEATPDNEFSLGQLVRNKKKGTAVLNVTVPGPGRLVLSGSRVRGVEAQVGAGPAALAVAATGKAARKLKRKGKVGVAFTVTYTPARGTPNSKSTTAKLKQRRKKRR